MPDLLNRSCDVGGEVTVVLSLDGEGGLAFTQQPMYDDDDAGIKSQGNIKYDGFKKLLQRKFGKSI